ncbi:MAG: HU family DNA-binding protein [Phycicoccus sp.]
MRHPAHERSARVVIANHSHLIGRTSMTTKGLADTVAQRVDVSASTAEAVIGEALRAIGELLGKGEEVRLAGFGTFEARSRAARTGRNPQTGEEIQIAASTTVGFKPAAQLKRTVND